MKNVLFALVTIATLSVHAAQANRLQPDNDKKYNSYSLYESDVKTVSILVDYEKVKTDCHGLNYRYTVKDVGNSKFLVTKDMLAIAMFVCPATMPDKEVQGGIKFQIPVDKYKSAYVTIIAPEDSEVVAEVSR